MTEQLTIFLFHERTGGPTPDWRTNLRRARTDLSCFEGHEQELFLLRGPFSQCGCTELLPF